MTFPALRRRVAAFFVVLLCLLTVCPGAAQAISTPDIQATAVYLGDPETGLPLYEKNAEEKRYPASTTKIMTALIVLENVDDLEQKVTVKIGRASCRERRQIAAGAVAVGEHGS